MNPKEHMGTSLFTCQPTSFCKFQIHVLAVSPVSLFLWVAAEIWDWTPALFLRWTTCLPGYSSDALLLTYSSRDLAHLPSLKYVFIHLTVNTAAHIFIHHTHIHTCNQNISITYTWNKSFAKLLPEEMVSIWRVETMLLPPTKLISWTSLHIVVAYLKLGTVVIDFYPQSRTWYVLHENLRREEVFNYVNRMVKIGK